jgi:hypothetical protein
MTLTEGEWCGLVARIRARVDADPYPVENFPGYQDHPYVKGWRAAMATVRDELEAAAEDLRQDMEDARNG